MWAVPLCVCVCVCVCVVDDGVEKLIDQAGVGGCGVSHMWCVVVAGMKSGCGC